MSLSKETAKMPSDYNRHRSQLSANRLSTLNQSDPELLEPYTPSAADPWDRRKVAHLYRRAAFGASWSELEDGVRMGPEACIDRLMRGQGKWSVAEEDFAAIARTAVAAGNDRNLQGWWIFRMFAGGHPLAERFTLFWHDHFATSQDKVANLGLMHQQNEMFRRHALGHFWDRETGGILLAASRDPAMLVWLDSNSNRRAAPNENYAREIMELFALGIGNYTEQDIREAARAFTGWFVHKNEFRFNSSEHDSGVKTVLNRPGNWDGGDVVRIIAEQPATALYLVGKIYRYLVSENESPDSDVLEHLAQRFREHDYDVGWLVQTILHSRLFFSAAAYRQRIASPIDFTVGTAKRLEGSRVSPVALADVCAKLGQTLFHPPNVAGWEEGKAWINSSTLLGRTNFAQEIVATSGRFAGRTDPAALAIKYGRTSDHDIVDFFLELLVDGNVPNDTRTQLLQAVSSAGASEIAQRDRVRRLVQLILSLPEYNLC
jgi:uncharacterized protein (DUF1800 family)